MDRSLGFVGRDAILLLDAKARAARVETRSGEYDKLFVFVNKSLAHKIAQLPDSRFFRRDLLIMQGVDIDHSASQSLLHGYQNEPQVTIDECSDDLGYHLEEILQSDGKLVRCWTPRYLIYTVNL